ncbi:MAG: hypothetical protein CMG24_04885, partial [Candidatus Marinimicrobia bacterium]|nr:hypothetical protein [Candidatus Neomarinimicrobiota bacterium]
DGIDQGACDCDGNVLDCAGECGGSLIFDDCGICDGNNAGQDCNGDCFGDAYLDDCGECVGGSTGFDECSSNVDISMELHEGANLISFYAVPEDNSLDNMMSSLDDVMIGVIGEGLAANLLPNGNWVGSLTEISETSGYWVKIDGPGVLSVSDAIPSDPSLVYDLHAGANLISYPSNIPMSVSDAVSDEYHDYINGFIGEGEAASLLPNGNWVGSLTEFQGNKGYWFKVSEGFDFNFDISDEDLVRTVNSNVRKSPQEMGYVQSMNQAFYFIEDVIVDGVSIDSGSLILAYNEDVLVGARQWTGEYIDVPAMGYDNSIETAGYLESGDNIRFELLDLDGNRHILAGESIPSWDNNQIFHSGVLTNINIPNHVSIVSAYPNPFNPATNIEFGLSRDSDVNVSIYDINGRLIEVLVEGYFFGGFHNVNWDASGYPSGIYFAKIISDNKSVNQKLVLMK